MSERITYKDLPVERSGKVKMTVTMEVSASQAYALQAMFDYWSFCGRAGMSRHVSFYVDGDGDFQPKCDVKTEPVLPPMGRSQSDKSIIWDDHGNRQYDYDPIGWSLHDEV